MVKPERPEHMCCPRILIPSLVFSNMSEMEKFGKELIKQENYHSIQEHLTVGKTAKSGFKML